MNEWPAAVWASVSAMMAALVLSMIFLLGSFARQAVEIQHIDDNAIAIVKEYRKFSPYDGTSNLVAADVITAIAESRGQPEVWVDTISGTETSFDWMWTADSPHNLFRTSVLVELIPAQARYDAMIVKDLNGSVERIEFRRQ